MIRFQQLLLYIVASLFVLAVILLGLIGLRLAFQAFRRRRLLGESRRYRELIEQQQKEGFRQLEGMLFALGDGWDPDLLDDVLRDVMHIDVWEQGELSEREKRVFHRTGLVDRHLQRLVSARTWRERADSALLLARVGDPRAISHLTATLRDPSEDTTVKAAAARALGMFRAEGTAEALLAELRVVNEWSSPRVADLLVKLGAPAVAPCIVATEDENPNLRSWAAQVLGRLGAREAVPSVIALLRDDWGQVRVGAAEALGRLRDPRSIQQLTLLMLHDTLAQVRAEAAQALGLIRDRQAIGALVAALRDPDYWTRLRAVEALVAIRPQDPALLVEALEDVNPEVRRRAAAALERVGFVEGWIDALGQRGGAAEAGAAEARERLLAVAREGIDGQLREKLEQHPDAGTRARLAVLLGEARCEAARPMLLAALQDRSAAVRAGAVRGYAWVAGGDAAPIPALLEDRSPAVRAAAVQALRALLPASLPAATIERVAALGAAGGRLGRDALELLDHLKSPLAVQVARSLLADPAAAHRLVAARVLADAGEGDELVGALADPAQPVRVVAAQALREDQDPAVRARLLQATAEADADSREALSEAAAGVGLGRLLAERERFARSGRQEPLLAWVWTLGKTGEPGAVPPLLELMADHRPRVRSAVAGALGRLGGPQAASGLERLLGDDDEYVRAAAVNGLARVAGAWALTALGRLEADADPFVRGRVILGQGRLGLQLTEGDPQRVALCARLEERLAGPVMEACHAAMAVLALSGRIEGPAAAWLEREGHDELLLDRLEPGHPVAERVLTVLQRNGAGRGGRIDLAGALKARAPEERLRALQRLQSWPADQPPELLLDALRSDPSPEVRQRAVELLAERLPGADAILAQALSDPAPPVRLRAVRVAGSVFGPAQAPLLLASVEGGGSPLDYAVERALARVFQDRCAELEALYQQLRGPADLASSIRREPARPVVLRALGRLGDHHALALLEEVLEFGAGPEQEAARDALARLGGSMAAPIPPPPSEDLLTTWEGESLVPLSDPEALPTRSQEEDLSIAQALYDMSDAEDDVVPAREAAVRGMLASPSWTGILRQLVVRRRLGEDEAALLAELGMESEGSVEGSVSAEHTDPSAIAERLMAALPEDDEPLPFEIGP